MRKFSLRLGLISFFMLLLTVVGAKEVEFMVNVPRVVALDEVFRLEFALNDSPKDFKAPNFNGFDILAGPSTSQGQSISIVNGSMTRTVNYTYTYVLQAQKEGKFTIAPASVTVDGKNYTTTATTIEVVASQSQGGATNSSSQNSAQRPAQATLAADDILIRTIVDKTNVYKGEPVKVIIKLYTRVPAMIEGLKYPSFNGFWSQEIPLKRQQAQRETLNSKIYETQILQQYMLYPQQSGELTIDEITSNIVAQIATSNRQRNSLIDDFFGAGPSVQEIRRVLRTEPITINVKALPAGAPEGFSGAVGRFKLNQELQPKNVTANSPTTLTLRLSGEGNLPLIQAPKVELPSSFEQYPVKTSESLNTTDAGINGYRQFEYLFIARAGGQYDIDSVKFSYFDPKLSRYITLDTPSEQLTVAADTTVLAMTPGVMVSPLSKEDLKILRQDIRFIKLGRANLKMEGNVFFASVSYFVILGLILALFVFSLIFLNKQIKLRQNEVFVKGKKANKVALKRFKAASVYIKQDDKRGFYEEMLRALWGYVSDKLNIPVASLTKDNVRQELMSRGVELSSIDEFTDLISLCEYAQYSPDTSSQMNEYFAKGVALISKYESIIK